MLVKSEFNRMVRNRQIFAPFGKNDQPFLRKCWRHFRGGFFEINNCPMLKYCLETIIFQCSKIYGNPTCENRLKFASNMEIPSSPNEKGTLPLTPWYNYFNCMHGSHRMWIIFLTHSYIIVQIGKTDLLLCFYILPTIVSPIVPIICIIESK